jgi:hypothetical protein
MKATISLLSLTLCCTLGMLLAAESSVSIGALPPTIYALAESRDDGKPGTTNFYNLPRSPATAMAIFGTKNAAEGFIATLTEGEARKLVPFALERSFVRSVIKMGVMAILLDPVSAAEGGTPVVDGTPAGEESKDSGKPQLAPLVLNSSLRNELLERGKRDQEIRLEVIRQGNDHAPADVRERMIAIDKENREWLSEIIHQYGWPGPELVGVEATQVAWLLVQHSDVKFQKQCLPLVKEAYLAGKLSGGDFALLQDRVLVEEGKPQIYGSQAMPVGQWNNGQPVFHPIEDEKNVDKRRAEVGLGPLADYIKSLKSFYLTHSDADSTESGSRAGSESRDGKAVIPAKPSRDPE